MPETTRVPDGDGTTLQLTALGGGSHFEEVNEGIGATDDASSKIDNASNNSTRSDFLDFEDMPGDFGVAVDVAVNMRSQIAGVVDDTVDCRVDIFSADESTLIETCVTLAGDHSWATTNGSAQANTDSLALWNGYKVRCQMFRSNSGMPDSILMEISTVDIVINYDVAGAVDEEFAGTLAERPTLHNPKEEAVSYGMAVGTENE